MKALKRTWFSINCIVGVVCITIVLAVLCRGRPHIARRSLQEVSNGPCGDFQAEVYVLLDSSVSFNSYIEKYKQATEEAFTKIKSEMPNSKMALASFSDKPIWPFGIDDAHMTPSDVSPDQCYKNVLKMTDDQSQVQTGLNSIQSNDGGDSKEAHMDALYYGIQSTEVGWTSEKTDPVTGSAVLRVVVMATDARWHKPNSMSAFTQLPSIDSVDTLDSSSCTDTDYIEEDAVVQAIQNKGIHPIFLVSKYSKFVSYVSEWLAFASKLGKAQYVVDVDSLEIPLSDAIVNSIWAASCATTGTTTTGTAGDSSGGTTESATDEGPTAPVAIIVASAAGGLLLLAAPLGYFFMSSGGAAAGAASTGVTNVEHVGEDQHSFDREAAVDLQEGDDFFGDAWN
eukprot:Lankesteria_metandrocarpae@DN1299_c0_g1_i2.p1